MCAHHCAQDCTHTAQNSSDDIPSYLPDNHRIAQSLRCCLQEGEITENIRTGMWADAQRDGRPPEYKWHPLRKFCNFIPIPHCKVWLTPTTRVPCSNAAKTRNPLKRTGVPQTRQQILVASGPTFTVLSEHVEEVLLFNKFFSDCRYMP